MALGTPTTAGNSSTSGTVSVTLTNSVGDLLLAVVSCDQAALTITPPSGGTWTALRQGSLVNVDGQKYAIYVNTSGPGSASYSWGFSGAVVYGSAVTMLAVSGQAGTSPINIDDITVTDSSQASPISAVSPSVTTTVDGCLVVAAYVLDITALVATSATAPAGFSGMTWQSAAADYAHCGLSYSTQSTAGATGTATTTVTGGAAALATFTIAIAPAATTPGTVSAESGAGTGAGQAAGISRTFYHVEHVATGAVASGTAAITPALPTGILTDDVLLLFLETANQAITIPTPNGGTWTEVTGSPQGTGTAAGTSATRLTCFWSRYNGTQGAPTTSDSGDHQVGVIVAYRGCVTSGNPWDVTSSGVEATSDTSWSITGATTTVANCRVVIAGARMNDAAGAHFSAWTNADLSDIQERFDDGTTQGNGGGIGIADGLKATAGAYGATTVTNATTTVKAFLTIALKANQPSSGTIVTADAAAATGAGQTAATLESRLVTAAQADATGAGQVASLVVGGVVVADSGTGTGAGQTANTLAARVNAATTGAATGAGQTATVSSGSYTITNRTATTVATTSDGAVQMSRYQMYGNRLGFIDNGASGSGHKIMAAQTANYIWFYWTENGSSYSHVQVAAIGGTNWRLCAVCQSHDGKIHLLTQSSSDGSIWYRRMSVTYSGGAMSSFSSDAYFQLMAGPGAELRFEMQSIRTQDNSSWLAIAYNYAGASDNLEGRVSLCPATIASSSELVGINGSGTYTVIVTGAYQAPATSHAHTHSMWFIQNPSTKALIFGVGFVEAEMPTTDDVIAHYFASTNGATTWATGTLVNEAVTEYCHGSFYAVGSNVYRSRFGNSTTPQVRFDKIDSSGTITYNAFPVLSGSAVSGDYSGWAVFGVSDDETRCYCVTYTYFNYLQTAHCVGTGGTWVVNGQADIGYSQGLAGVGWGRGVVAMTACDGNAPSSFAGVFDSTVDAAPVVVTADAGASTGAGQTASTLASKLTTAAQGSATGSGQTASTLRAALLTADYGAATGSGQAAGPLASKLTTATAGGSTGAGQVALVLRGGYVGASQGSATGDGQSAGALAAWLLVATSGTGTGAGQVAGITLGTVTGITVTALQGDASGAGQIAGVIAPHLVGATSGAAAGAGSTAIPAYGRLLTAGAGASSGSGQTATVQVVRIVAADSGAATGAGAQASPLASWLVTSTAGAAVGAGQVATISLLNVVTVTANPGAATGDGAAAGLRAARIATAEQGIATGTGQIAGFAGGKTVAADPGSASGAGYSVAIPLSYVVTATAGAGTGIGQIALLTLSNIPIVSDWRVIGTVRAFASITSTVRTFATITGKVRT